MSRILVGIPTYAGHRFALIPMIQGLQKQTLQEFDIVVVDNSEDLKYILVLEQALKAAFPKKEVTVLHVDVPKKGFERILVSRKAIRQHFLARKKYSHLFFLDSDVVLQKTAIARLVARRKPLVTGIYVAAYGTQEKPEIRPCIWLDQGGEKAKQATIQDILKNDILEIGAGGLGCTLIEREILEKVDFRIANGTEDVMFYRDAVKELKITPYADCTVKCLHMNYPMGDERNKPFDLPRYKLK